MSKPLLIAAVLAVSACGDGEERRLSLVDNPRILAVSSTPSVIGPGETATLDALVVDGAGSLSDESVAWRACAPWSLVLDPDVDCGPDASVPLSAGVVEAPAALQEPVVVPVVAEVVVDDVRLVAVKRVRIFPVPPEPRPSIAVDELTLDGVSPGGFEPGRGYQVAVGLSGVFADKADVRVNLYATAGEFEDESVEISLTPDQQDDTATTRWTAPDGASGVHFWLVATGPESATSWLEVGAE